MYNSFRGTTKDKFKFNTHRKTGSITEGNFFKWTSGHMYRTSYNDMSKKGASVERKNMVIPKYQGYVPSLKADSHLQKRITEQSREVLNRQYLDDPPQMMASTGFNPVFIPKHDATLESTSRRYGTRTMPSTHPANHSKYAPNATTFRASFLDPKSQPRAVYRTRNPEAEFSRERQLNCTKLVTDKTNLHGPRQALIDNCSGYTMNSTLWDSTSWATEQNLHTDQERTQYRKQFNQPKPFHARAAKYSTGRMPRLQATYEPADMQVTGFGGRSFHGSKQEAKARKNLNYRRFEENGKNTDIDCE